MRAWLMASSVMFVAEMDIMAALLDAQYGPTSVDEEQDMVVLQARSHVLQSRHRIASRCCCPCIAAVMPTLTSSASHPISCFP